MEEPNAILDKNNITDSDKANRAVSEEDDIINMNSEEDGIITMPSEEENYSDSAPYIMNSLPNLNELTHRRSGRSLKPTIKIIEERECQEELKKV